MSDETLFLILLASAVCMVVWAAWWLLSGRNAIEERLESGTGASIAGWGQGAPTAGAELANLLNRAGQTIGKPPRFS